MADAQRTLSEHASKVLLTSYGVEVAREVLAESPAEAVVAAREIGFPVALKLCGEGIAHKTERNLVCLDLGDAVSVEAAAESLLGRRRSEDVGLLVGQVTASRSD
jgi:acyl-CoA synthetase (NDP forming)